MPGLLQGYSWDVHKQYALLQNSPAVFCEHSQNTHHCYVNIAAHTGCFMQLLMSGREGSKVATGLYLCS